MTSHVHLIIGTHGAAMENIMRDMKRHTSEKLRDSKKKLSVRKPQGLATPDDGKGWQKKQ